MLPEIPLEQLCATLDEVAAEQLEISGIAEPPVDAFHLADAIGLTVGRDERLSNRARLVRLHVGAGHSHASILLAPEPRAPQRHGLSHSSILPPLILTVTAMLTS